MKILLAVATVALALAAPALAAYPGTYGLQGVAVTSPDGTLSFSASRFGADTRLLEYDARGALVRSATVTGAFGIPTLITHENALGMFHDGSAFVVQSTAQTPATSFRIVSTGDLAVLDRITLHGSWAFDALSPDGATLYLIQHRSAGDFQHYVVRAFDLRAHALEPGRIADKAQRGWTMRGYPAGRAATADGRWVYTLYSNPGGFPFVHALDTVAGVAHCVGFAWKGDQGELFGYSLRLHGGKLLVLRTNGGVYRSIDRTTWAVSLR